LSRTPCEQDELHKRIVGFLRASGSPCYMTGGAVRDWVRDAQAKDLDVTVPSGAIKLARRLADHTGGAFYVLDRETDAARIIYSVPVHLTVDVAALRGPDIDADLRARDFTVNAMAIDLQECFSLQPMVLDPCAGRQDLKDGVLRATGESAFQQDPVRLIRAVRFWAMLGLRIEPQTVRWIRRDAALINQPSAERVRQELALIMAEGKASEHLRFMDRLGLLCHVLPEVVQLKGVEQSAPHIYDVFEHTLVSVAQTERLGQLLKQETDPDVKELLEPFADELHAHLDRIVAEGRTRLTLLKLAALLHDTGKPSARSVEQDGRIRFFGHERNGAQIAVEVMRRLRFSAKETQLVGTMVQHHMRPGWLLQSAPVTRRAVYRFFRDTGDAGVEVILLALADQLATRGQILDRDHWRDYLILAAGMLDHYFRRPSESVSPPTLISGSEVMAVLGLSPGPRIGELLEAVREAQAEGTVRTEEDAMAFLRSEAKRQGG
jgi:poly(A) polymerase